MQPASADTPPPPPLKRWFPSIYLIILVINVVIFVVTMYVNNCPKLSLPPAHCYASFLGRFSFQPREQNRLLGPSDYPLIKMGGLHVETLVHKHQAWRIFTSLWVHAGVVQLLITMCVFIIIGKFFLDKTFGLVRIGLVYVISGMGGNLLSVLFTKSSISVGASPAIFGLLGAILSEFITNWEMHHIPCAKMGLFIGTIVIYLLGPFPFADSFSHIGGLISGFLLGFVFLIRPQYKWVNWTKSNLAPPVPPKHKPYQIALCIISLMLLSAGFISGLVLFFKGVDLNSYCSWCHYVTCFTNLYESERDCKQHYDSCDGYQIGNQLNVTCVTNGRNGIFPLSSGNPLEQYEELCFRLCSV